jgi:hypothetical protein
MAYVPITVRSATLIWSNYAYKWFFAPTVHISSLMAECFVLIDMSINFVLLHKLSKIVSYEEQLTS